MASYRAQLPQLGDRLFLTDSGLETTLVFKDGYDLPAFAAFPLLDTDGGRTRLAEYYRAHAAIAAATGCGYVFESVGWRANRDWGEQIGYTPGMLDRVNRDSIEFVAGLRSELERPEMPMVISGCVGPRDDAYNPGRLMTENEAEDYHRTQIATLSETDADLISALTLTNTSEAIGIVRAAQFVAMPVAISFTVETDGALPSGTGLGEAIEIVDEATEAAAAYFMVNCAHPTHFDATLEEETGWVQRIRGVRANSSRKSHAELDEAEELDDGDPVEFGQEYAQLRARFPQITILGGCCGTDERHIQQIARACNAAP
jgi:S-methylmethionine-dependent homocysteine/selenocysteine methylase